MAITLTVTPTTITAGEKVTATVNWDYTDVCLYVIRVTIFWGDGTTDYIQDPLPCAGTQIWEHIYGLEGTYDVWSDIQFVDLVGTVVVDSSNHVLVEVTPVVVSPLPPPLPPPPIPIKPDPPLETPPVEVEPEPPPPCGDLDAETFHEFWVNWGHRVDRLAFEVPLDDGVDVPDLPEPWRSVWKHLTHHRIDVVFERKGVLYVAEIKPRLSIAAIGTAIVATTMIKQKYNVSRFADVRPAVISQYGSPTLIQAAATHRVVIFLTRGIDGLYEPVALHDVIW